MSNLFDEPNDGTLLTEEEKQGLIPSYISNREELNKAEQQNIIKAEIWAFGKKRNPLDLIFLKSLHKRMYENVWEWAGEFRHTERNIGIAPYRIATELKRLVEDVRYQMDNNSFHKTEIAARFHHRLVYIHPFPNGNGRHGRLATDILLRFMDVERFVWGAGNLSSISEIRTTYISALRAADNHDYEALLNFLRPSNP